MPETPPLPPAAQTREEAVAFVEAFARINVEVIRRRLGSPTAEIARAESGLEPDWDDPRLLEESGLDPAQVDEAARSGTCYLHIDVAASVHGGNARRLFLDLTGLSAKLQKMLFPALSSRPDPDRARLAREVRRLNAWLGWARRDGFDPAAFITYQRSLGIHGETQNLTGAIGAAGAAIAFIDAIRELDPAALVDHVGDLPPPEVRSPIEVFDWREFVSRVRVRCGL